MQDSSLTSMPDSGQGNDSVTKPNSLVIVYQDDELVAIDKPAGLLVHRSWIAAEARQFAVQLLRDQLGRYVYPIHRLDRPTSGILLFALNANTARLMSERFASRDVHKLYHAVVRGYVPEHGHVDYSLREEQDKIADKLASKNKAAQPATTDFMCLKRVELPYKVSKKHDTSRFSLVQLSPKTGRKHQLRRHMAHLRHPIIGDTNHGDGRQNTFFREHYKLNRLMLCATGLQFKHPSTSQEVNIRVPIPESFLLPFEDNSGTLSSP